ncbi:MAG: hypoxanthine phosphoribosyltransferase [Gammaproteobacteria bacterium]|nr:hypoxanthine phosphoribosyltransferase [Gammaproteobacteria bacterium]NNF61219.1 hypoxanthine phosphoribosyltransferase [Gammaproteobacteria bacterium]NNM20805.1 hypoxanthine phosphoribosyltransferase [Gammaproteobacteria bacterium]
MSELNASILISQKEIQRRVDELAAEISADYADKGPLVIVGILKGAFMFLADLSRCLTVPRVIEFIAVSSYDDGSTSGGVRLIMDLRDSIAGKHVLIVEDIVDSGNTLNYLIEMLETRNPASIRTCALLQKPGRTQVEVKVDYSGFNIPDEWVVGYGLDYAEKDRTLPYIGIINIDGS